MAEDSDDFKKDKGCLEKISDYHVLKDCGPWS